MLLEDIVQEVLEIVAKAKVQSEAFHAGQEDGVKFLAQKIMDGIKKEQEDAAKAVSPQAEANVIDIPSSESKGVAGLVPPGEAS